MLIEKEWLSFGHKFSDRCGHLRTTDSKEQSPVFLQFIEAVWQLSEIYPTAFEFNERFLIFLHDHSHSCQYGNFVGNCEKDRRDLKFVSCLTTILHLFSWSISVSKSGVIRFGTTSWNMSMISGIHSSVLSLPMPVMFFFQRSILKHSSRNE